ncbi:MAG: GAF domain-containing protein [Anaerolineales bacterium]|nr:GAF domain-containing protein [Anaerolineales bacterium]
MTTPNPAVALNPQEWRERFIRVILKVASLLGVVILAAAFPIAAATDRILYVVLYLLLLAAAFASMPYAPRVYILLAVILAVGVDLILTRGVWANGSLFLMAAVVLASLLLDNRADFITLGVIAIFHAVIAGLSLGEKIVIHSPTGNDVGVMGWVVYVADFVILGAIVLIASTMLKNALAKAFRQISDSFLAVEIEKKRLEERVQKRTEEIEAHINQFRASTAIAQVIAQSQGYEDLLENIVRGVAQEFNYSHVGVFILDHQKRNVYLQTVSEKGDASMLGQIFRLSADRKNPLNVAIEKNVSILVSGTEGVNFARDPNFPRARSRMIIPLTARGNQIGALDIQSSRLSAFKQEDVEVLETLADLTATTYNNILLNEEINRIGAQLETSASAQTQQIWSKFTSRNKSAYQYTPAGVRPIFSREKGADPDALYVPVVLHEQTIGTIKLKKRKGDAEGWTERQRDLVEKISAQTALALENSRLVDEAQKSALRNQMIATFSSHVRETLDIDTVIQAAATELRKVFDLKEAEVIIGSAPSSSQTDDKG